MGNCLSLRFIPQNQDLFQSRAKGYRIKIEDAADKASYKVTPITRGLNERAGKPWVSNESQV